MSYQDYPPPPNYGQWGPPPPQNSSNATVALFAVGASDSSFDVIMPLP
jgi:hypothetical protein